MPGLRLRSSHLDVANDLPTEPSPKPCCFTFKDLKMYLVFKTGQGIRHKTMTEMLEVEANMGGKLGTRGLRTQQVQLCALLDTALPLCIHGMDIFSSWNFCGVA